MNYKDAVIKYFSDHQDDYDSDIHEVSKISDTTAIKLHKLICKGCNNETEIDTETDEELWWFYHYYETKGESQLEYLKQLADRGDVLAMFEIGRDLECSSFDEVKSDMIKYFSMAAEKGHVESMYKLGKHYYHEKDLSKAKKYLEMAISKGHAKAHCAIAICYVDEVIANSNDSDSDFEIPETTMDKNVSADEMDKALKIAKTHLLVGVAVDDVESMMLLGQLYLCFKPMDLAMGEKYSTMAYEKSLEKKDYTCYGQQALFNLGHYFRAHENYERMHHYWDMIPEKCRWKSQAYCSLGYEYLDEGDRTKAVGNFQKALEWASCPNSLYGLGIIYEKENNWNEAEKCFEKASDMGNVASMMKIAEHYRMPIWASDNQTPAEEQKMVKYYKMASHYKHKKAISMLASVYLMDRDKKYPFIDKLRFFYEHNQLSRLKLDDQFETNTEVLDFVREMDISKCSDLLPNHIIRILHNMIKHKIDLYELHFKYSPDASGFEEAKKDFYNHLNTNNL